MIDTKDWTTTLVFQSALNHQLAGVMFHHDAYRFFKYLGLLKMAKLQHERYKEEQNQVDNIICAYLDRYDILLDGKLTDYKAIIPNEVYSTKASAVGNEYKRKMLSSFMNAWTEWEDKTEKLYQAIVSWCVSNQQADAHFFSKMVMGVCKERQLIHCLMSQMAISNYDLTTAESIISKI